MISATDTVAFPTISVLVDTDVIVDVVLSVNFLILVVVADTVSVTVADGRV